MPRGVAVPDVRQHLFAALERVVNRDGAGSLNTRAVTGEAGVATGLLYTHFAGLDDLLAGYAVDRSFQLAAEAGALRDRVGSGDVVDNLAGTIESWSQLSGFVRLVAARPGLLGGVRDVLGDAGAALDAVESAVGEYLVAEQRGGRLARGTDLRGLAVAVAAAIHHHALTAPDNTAPDNTAPENTVPDNTAPENTVRERLRRTLAAIVDGRVSAVD